MVEHAMVIADQDGRIVFWNDAAEESFGYGAAEAVGQRVDLIVPEEIRDRHWEGFHRVMAGGARHLEGAAINLPVRVRTGEVLAFPARFHHLTSPQGEMTGALAVFSPRRGDEEPWTPIES